MGRYEDRVLPRLVDWTCGTTGFDRWRDRATTGLAGTVVELGFGSGRNVGHYPVEVDRILAVEPSDLGWDLSAERRSGAGTPIERVGLDGQRLPLDDATCDAVLCTFTLCTIPDPAAALAEARRVLVPGGRLHFLEHGRSPDPGVHRRQRRLEPIQRRLAGGCHLTREPAELVAAAGFRLEDVMSRQARGPKAFTYLTVGTALA